MEIKLLKQKKLDKETVLKISQVENTGRIFVEFSSTNGRLVVQKSFQNTPEGIRESKDFQKKIKSNKDLRKYFGLDK